MDCKSDRKASVEIAASQNEDGSINLALKASKIKLTHCSERAIHKVIDRSSIATVMWDGVPLGLRVVIRLVASVKGSQGSIEATAIRKRITDIKPRIC